MIAASTFTASSRYTLYEGSQLGAKLLAGGWGELLDMKVTSILRIFNDFCLILRSWRRSLHW
jgi:hypothetical protein